jgi:hypothetical protein
VGLEGHERAVSGMDRFVGAVQSKVEELGGRSVCNKSFCFADLYRMHCII